MLKEHIAGNHSTQELKEALHRLSKHTDINSAIIFTASGTDMIREEYDEILQASDLQIIGGVFPEIVYEGDRYSNGSIVIGLESEIQTIWMDQDCTDPSVKLMDKYAEINPEGKTVFVIADALYAQKSTCVEALYNTFGSIPNYVGGGAGSLSFQQFPCIYTNEGLKYDGIQIGITDLKTTIGVAHGWTPISETMKVTESTGNIIHSLDWRPAKEVYQEIVEQHSGSPFDFENFFDTTKSYPFGISKLDAEMVVRDPFSYDGDDIHVIDNIDTGSHIKVLYGNMDSLLSGAEKAYSIATEKNEYSDLILIDCISRVLFLEENFNKELQKVDPKNKGFGALTLGEIANNGDAFLEVFNKTVVVCAINE